MSETNQKTKDIKVEILDVKQCPWTIIRDEIMDIEKSAFGQKADPEEALKGCFENPKAVIVVARQAGAKIIGYSYSIPDPEDKTGESALLDSVAILPEYQGLGLVGQLSNLLEKKLDKLGYVYMTARAQVANGYADKMQKHYADRIVSSLDLNNQYGQQRYFKIKL